MSIDGTMRRTENLHIPHTVENSSPGIYGVRRTVNPAQSVAHPVALRGWFAAPRQKAKIVERKRKTRIGCFDRSISGSRLALTPQLLLFVRSATEECARIVLEFVRIRYAEIGCVLSAMCSLLRSVTGTSTRG